MNLISRLTSFSRWLHLPVGLLLVFLQRTPGLRVASEALDYVLRAPSAEIYKGIAALAVSLGAVQTVAGATEFVATPNSTLTAEVGKNFYAVFNINGAPGGKKPQSWSLKTPTPKGLYFAATPNASSGVTLTSIAPFDLFADVVNVSSSGPTSGNLYLIGVPNETGTFTFELTAWEEQFKRGNSGGPYRVTLVVSAPTVSGPVVTAHPVSLTQVAGSSASLTVAATGADLTYQWRKEGVAIPGATSPTLSFPSLSPSDAATYTAVVTSGATSITSRSAQVQVATPVQGELVNLSLLGKSGGAGGPLTVGFVANGRELLVRAAGPSLGAFGVSGAMADPVMAFFAPEAVTSLARNDNWFEGANAAAVRSAINSYTGFRFPEGSKDAAFIVNATGSRTAQVLSATNEPGVVLVEAYALTGGPGRLTNVSTLNYAGTGAESLTLGFIISGNVPVPLLIRGLGPRLASLGVSEAMRDPKIVLFDSSSREIASNDDWGTEPGAEAATKDWTGLPLVAGSNDAALVVTLPPGSYTVQLSPAVGAGGQALIELYEMRR